jgi:hypothetical protein
VHTRIVRVEEPVAILVDRGAGAELVRGRIHGGVGVVAVARLLRRPDHDRVVARRRAVARSVPVGVAVLVVHDAADRVLVLRIERIVAVVVDLVAADLGGLRMDRRVGVVTVPGRGGEARRIAAELGRAVPAPAIGVLVGPDFQEEAFVDLSRAVVVDAVARLDGSRRDGRVAIVAVGGRNPSVAVAILFDRGGSGLALAVRCAGWQNEPRHGLPRADSHASPPDPGGYTRPFAPAKTFDDGGPIVPTVGVHTFSDSPRSRRSARNRKATCPSTGPTS